MASFNFSTRQMSAKIVYYGPGLCGKTTSLKYIFHHTRTDARGKMVSLATETDRTLFFDLLPLEVGTVAGFHTRIQLYTVPGQVFYNSTRRLVLKGVDGIVFVADSQPAMLPSNVESFRNLEVNLNELGIDLEEIPMVLQYNKRDLPEVCSCAELHEALNSNDWPEFETSAISGDGIFEVLREISKQTLISLKQQLEDGVPETLTPPPHPKLEGVAAPEAEPSQAEEAAEPSAEPTAAVDDAAAGPESSAAAEAAASATPSLSDDEIEDRALDQLGIEAAGASAESVQGAETAPADDSDDQGPLEDAVPEVAADTEVEAGLEVADADAQVDAEVDVEIERPAQPEEPEDSDDADALAAQDVADDEDPGIAESGADIERVSTAEEVAEALETRDAELEPAEPEADVDTAQVEEVDDETAALEPVEQAADEIETDETDEDGEVAALAQTNGRRAVDQALNVALPAHDLARAQHLSFDLQVRDERDRVLHQVRDIQWNLSDIEDLQEVLLRLKIELEREDA